MAYSFDEAKAKVGLLREKTDGEPCEVTATEEKMGMVPDEEKYDLKLLTPTYELTPGIITALHRTGPFSVRHLGKVKENDSRHVWLIEEQD